MYVYARAPASAHAAMPRAEKNPNDSPRTCAAGGHIATHDCALSANRSGPPFAAPSVIAVADSDTQNIATFTFETVKHAATLKVASDVTQIVATQDR